MNPTQRGFLDEWEQALSGLSFVNLHTVCYFSSPVLGTVNCKYEIERMGFTSR